MPHGFHTPADPGPGELQIRTARRGRTFVIALHGEVDLHTVVALRRVLLRAEATWSPQIELDLSQLSFIDVAGVHEITAFRRRVESAGAKALTLQPGPRAVRRAFELADVASQPAFGAGENRADP